MQAFPPLSIVTPVSRPGNVPAVLESIIACPKPRGMNVNWLLIFDAKAVPSIPDGLSGLAREYPFVRCMHFSGPGDCGNPQRNHGIDLGQRGFLYFLDDDNLLHERLLLALAEELQRQPLMGALLFHQRSPSNGRYLAASREAVRPCHIDTAQFIVHTDLVGSVRWHPFGGCSDGIFIEQLYNAQPDRFVFRDEVLCYYNELR